jgi:hypothetical protein
MTRIHILVALGVAALSACTVSEVKNPDTFIDSNDLTQLRAGIWVDPEGCDHWIIDDGVEGYLMARLHRDGSPVCNSEIAPNTVYGPFKEGAGIVDLM